MVLFYPQLSHFTLTACVFGFSSVSKSSRSAIAASVFAEAEDDSADEVPAAVVPDSFTYYGIE